MAWKVSRAEKKRDVDVSFSPDMSFLRIRQSFLSKWGATDPVRGKNAVQVLIDDEAHRLGLKFIPTVRDPVTDFHVKQGNVLCPDLEHKDWIKKYRSKDLCNREFVLSAAPDDPNVDFFIQF